MKPHNPVTLIDLEGKPICQYVEGKTEIYYDEGVYDGCLVIEPTGVKVNGEKHRLKLLMAFLQDQLTFIRNGMWKTLAIYQSTLGRYWEVPTFDIKDADLFYKLKVLGFVSGLHFKGNKHLFKPTPSQFFKHYPDVFSQITAYEGESTECY